MKPSSGRIVAGVGLFLLALAAAVAWGTTRRQSPVQIFSGAPSKIVIDYPLDGTIFPPELPAPTWQWRDGDERATSWEITITFADQASPIRVRSAGEPLRVGESDTRAVSSTNEPPALTPEQAAAHTWTPGDAVWSELKMRSVEGPATIAISGYRGDDSPTEVSRGEVSISTSKDSVGAPIFYRDVPLMPSENEKGVIKPLAPQAVPLIAWRLRNVAEDRSRLLMEGLHTCANCHSFSADGKTLGMDMDGPQNDKGLYALVDVKPRMTIRSEDLVAWSTFRGKLGSKLRVGFMSQVSPDGQHVITTVNDPGVDQTDYRRGKDPIDLVRNYYVANFRDYRFLQVFFPTRGLLAWYSRESERLSYLPGADDPLYVHANAVWSPDGKYLVFARAAAQDAYPEGAPTADHAGDPKERQIQYDLYRIPFNDGKGGEATPIAGASQNGMSNSFPKISPDGRWVVFVQSKNGMLMRPDGQLYIVPTAGGEARRMRCNTRLMNSWHSFSPNGRWMVFSSKSRSPYTQMFLTHIDEAGNDSPPVLIENATAANRAVNIPEFVNIPPDGIVKIDTPAADHARHMDRAVDLMKKGRYAEAVPEWNQALALAPRDWRAHNSLGVALMETGKVDEAVEHYREALALNPEYAEAYNNLGEASATKGSVDEAIAQFEKAVASDPTYSVARANLGRVLVRTGRADEAIALMRRVVELTPEAPDAHRDLGHALAERGNFEEASGHLTDAIRLSDGQDPLALHLLGRVYADLGRRAEALQTERQALSVAVQQRNSALVRAINAHLVELTQQQ